MKKTIILTLALFSLLLIYCKEDPPVVSEETYTFSGKAYSIVDSQKIYMENVKILFREDSTFTDIDGAFSFAEVPSGEYQVTFIYTSIFDSLESITNEVTINGKDKFEEYQLDLGEIPLFSFVGKVYYTLDSQKVYKENVKVLFMEDSTLTDIDGSFSFAEVPSGEYELTIIYTSLTDTPESITTKVTINGEDKFEEYFLYEQKSGISNFEDFFPLEVGNIWFYEINDAINSRQRYEAVETEYFNNLLYYKMKSTNSSDNTTSTLHYSLDPNTGFLYVAGAVLQGVGYIKTDLSLEEGAHIITNGERTHPVFVSVSQEEVLGEMREVRIHNFNDGNDVASSWFFADGIGLIKTVSCYFGCYTKTLFGAVINNVEHGDTSFIRYNKELAYYPMAKGNQWFYTYTETTALGDTLRSTYLKRENIDYVVFGNDKTYSKIKNTFSDSSKEFFDWQRIDSSEVKLYGYNTIERKEYLIDKLINDYIGDNSGEYFYSKSHMPSILPYGIYDFESKYPTTQTKTYYGWSSYWSDANGEHYNEAFYEFTKYIGISKIKITLNNSSPTIFKEIKLIGSIIDGNTTGTVW